MSDQGGEGAPTPPEAMVRVQPISDSNAFKRHLLRTFEQGQPHYAYADELDAAPCKLWPEMVPDFVEAWQPIDTGGSGPKRSVIALALTFSMPVGTDPAVNEAAVLAMARKVFAGTIRSGWRASMKARSSSCWSSTGMMRAGRCRQVRPTFAATGQPMPAR